MGPGFESPLGHQKEGQPFGLSFFLGFAAHRAAALFRLKCSGTAKPPLRNSSLRSEFTPHSRRGPEGPCRGLGCDLVLGADLESCPQNCSPVPCGSKVRFATTLFYAHAQSGGINRKQPLQQSCNGCFECFMIWRCAYFSDFIAGVCRDTFFR